MYGQGFIISVRNGYGEYLRIGQQALWQLIFHPISVHSRKLAVS
jgi:hypothetical protein